jgi:uncharacterized membrane protein YphA (DoxX/SURF4 family)
MIRLVLGGVFIYAAILKMRSPQDVADSMASFHLVPNPLIDLWALGLPLFELTSGLCLVTGYFCRIGLFSIMAMLTMFLGAIASTLIRGIQINCGCFGTDSVGDADPWIAVSRDMLLLLCAAYAYWYHLLRDGEAAG